MKKEKFFEIYNYLNSLKKGDFIKLKIYYKNSFCFRSFCDYEDKLEKEYFGIFYELDEDILGFSYYNKDGENRLGFISLEDEVIIEQVSEKEKKDFIKSFKKIVEDEQKEVFKKLGLNLF